MIRRFRANPVGCGQTSRHGRPARQTARPPRLASDRCYRRVPMVWSWKVSIVIQDKRDKRRIIECGARCALQLPTGDYKLVVRDPQGKLWTQRLSVRTPISAVVSPPDQGTRTLGIVLTMAGALGI